MSGQTSNMRTAMRDDQQNEIPAITRFPCHGLMMISQLIINSGRGKTTSHMCAGVLVRRIIKRLFDNMRIIESTHTCGSITRGNIYSRTPP